MLPTTYLNSEGFLRSCEPLPYDVLRALRWGRRRRACAPLRIAGSAGTACGSRPGAATRVERSGRRATESFGSLHIRIPLQFCQNLGFFSHFFKNSENVETSQHFPECSAKSREKIIKIGAKFDENCRKIMIFCRNSNKNSKTFDESLRIF